MINNSGASPLGKRAGRAKPIQPVQPTTPLPALIQKITIKVQSWIANYFHNRIVGNYCTFPVPLTLGTTRIVPEIILLTTNYNTVS